VVPTGNSYHLQRPTETGSKSMEDDISSKWNPKASRSTIFISDRTDFKPKLVKEKKEHDYLFYKGNNQSKRCDNSKYVSTEYW
jgi:hypothetical protein